MSPNEMTWMIAAVATVGVIIRPFGLPEAIWAVTGAALLVVLQLLSPNDALTGLAKGTDVYLFLTGMMLLSEIARQEGLFDWLAAVAIRRAKGSANRLFWLIYGVGTVVTVFLSNDATAVVLTPAVAAAVKAAKAGQPLPPAYLQPRKSGDLWQSYAATAAMAPTLFATLGAVDPCHLRDASLDAATRSQAGDCAGYASAEAVGHGQDGRARHCDDSDCSSCFVGHGHAHGDCGRRHSRGSC